MNSERDQKRDAASVGIWPTYRFDLGKVVATPAAMALLEQHGINPLLLLGRHLSGDWGDLCDDDKLNNDVALVDGGRIFSSYQIALSRRNVVDADDATTVWIITETKDDEGRRHSTCIMTPRCY